MELFLLLTALLSGLAGVSRGADLRVPGVVQAQLVATQVVSTRAGALRAAALVSGKTIASRPDGYLAAEPQAIASIALPRFAAIAAPERRRE